MADKTIRESFFDAKAIGSLWDVAVSLKRGNPLPIDADSVFESEAKLIEYIGDKITTVAYPGQVVAVVNADSTQIFYIDQELNYHPVGAKLDADGKSIKIDNNVLKLVGFDEAADGLLAQVKVDAEGNRTLNWVSIEAIAQGDGNTTYTFTGKTETTNVYFEVKASDAAEATKIYLDAYTKAEIDAKFEALPEDKDTTYTFTSGAEGKFTVTPKDGTAQEIDTGAKALVDALDKKVTDAGYQNASQVSTAIGTALENHYTKDDVDGKFSSATNVSVFNNDAKYQTESEVKTTVEAAIAEINHAVFQKVDAVPAVNDAADNVLYLVPEGDKLNIYAKISGEMVLVDDTDTDLTGYATETFVNNAIDALSAEGGAIKTVADDLDSLTNLHNGLVDDVEVLEGLVGGEDSGLVKDVADLKAINHDKIAEDAASAAITAHNADKSHLTASDVDGQIDAKLTTADYEGKIDTAKQEAIDAAALAVPVKTVNEDEFTLTDGKLEVKAIAQDKVTGLADVFAGIYTSSQTDEAIANAIGDKPTKTTGEDGKNSYSGASGIYVDIYTKDEVTDLIASFTGGESAADVLAELNKYKSSNDAKIADIEAIIGDAGLADSLPSGILGDIATINGQISDINTDLDSKLEGVKVNGVALAITDNVVDIPAATADVFGAVKLGAEFKANAETGALEVDKININKIEQTAGDVLILNGGVANDLIAQ